MVQMTYHQFTNRRLPKVRVETLKERFEEENQGIDQKIKAVKDSLKFFKVATAYSNYLEKMACVSKTSCTMVKFSSLKKRIRDIYYSFNENYHLGNRLSATKEALIKRLNSKVAQAAEN